MNMEAIISFLDASWAFLKGVFSFPRQEMAQDFYCIKESKEEEEDGIVNDEEIK